MEKRKILKTATRRVRHSPDRWEAGRGSRLHAFQGLSIDVSSRDSATHENPEIDELESEERLARVQTRIVLSVLIPSPEAPLKSIISFIAEM